MMEIYKTDDKLLKVQIKVHKIYISKSLCIIKEIYLDVDECNRLDRGNCSQFATCTNTPGSYICTCMPGFTDEDPDFPGMVCTGIRG